MLIRTSSYCRNNKTVQ